MPDVGISVDRRALANAIAETRHIRALVCFVCAQVKVDNGRTVNSDITLSSTNGVVLQKAWRDDFRSIKYNLSMPFFKSTYVAGRESHCQPWRGKAECLDNGWEWRCIFRFSSQRQDYLEMLCCPEDVERCKGLHDDTMVCRNCKIPLCESCRSYLVKHAGGNEGACKAMDGAVEVLPFCIPMALANDNMWGYTTSVLVRYKVGVLFVVFIVFGLREFVLNSCRPDWGGALSRDSCSGLLQMFRGCVRGRLVHWREEFRNMQAHVVY